MIRVDPTYEEVEADQSATGQAMAVVVAAGVAGGIGSMGQGLGIAAAAAVGSIIGWFIWAGLTWVIGTKLLPEPTTRADIGELLRTIGFSAAPGILGVLRIIPFIGIVISFVLAVWQLVAMVVAVRQALDYTSTGRAIAVCVIGWVIYMIVTVGLLTTMGVSRTLLGS